MLIFCNHIGAGCAVLLLNANLTSDVCLASLSLAQLDSAQKHPPVLHPLVLIFQCMVPYLREAKRAVKNQSFDKTALCTHFARAGTRCRTRCERWEIVLLPLGLRVAEFGLLLWLSCRGLLVGFLNIMADLHLQACSLLQLLPHLSINSLQMIFFFLSPWKSLLQIHSAMRLDYPSY